MVVSPPLAPISVNSSIDDIFLSPYLTGADLTLVLGQSKRLQALALGCPVVYLGKGTCRVGSASSLYSVGQSLNFVLMAYLCTDLLVWAVVMVHAFNTSTALGIEKKEGRNFLLIYFCRVECGKLILSFCQEEPRD